MFSFALTAFGEAELMAAGFEAELP